MSDQKRVDSYSRLWNEQPDDLIALCRHCHLPGEAAQKDGE